MHDGNTLNRHERRSLQAQARSAARAQRKARHHWLVSTKATADRLARIDDPTTLEAELQKLGNPKLRALGLARLKVK